MSYRGNDSFQDPKPFNTVSLINQRNHIKELIDGGLGAKALIEMATLVCEFDLNVKDKAMIELKDELKKNLKTPYLTSQNVIEYYDEINSYMNATYCRGFKAPMGEEFFEELESENSDSLPK